VGRAVPCVLGLFSVVVLLAQVLHPEHLPTRRAAWYAKDEATFIDALAAVRRHLWASQNQPPLATAPAVSKVSKSLVLPSYPASHSTLANTIHVNYRARALRQIAG
jgi:hypothetical protein